MASNAKKKTTMAKLNRENRQREKRLEKQARKAAYRALPPEERAGPMPDELLDEERPAGS
jgi:hypothetical protein